LASQNASSAPDTQADPPGALNLDSSSALETTQIVLLCSAASASFTTDPRRCATSSAAAAVAAASIYFFTMQTAGAACIRNSPSSSSSSPHERACAAIFMVQCNQQRDHLVSARERGPPLFLFPGLPLSKLHYLGCGSAAEAWEFQSF